MKIMNREVEQGAVSTRGGASKYGRHTWQAMRVYDLFVIESLLKIKYTWYEGKF